MSDSDEKFNKNEFKKKEHRPWKTQLLEMTIQESSGADNTDEIEFNLDLDDNHPTELEPLYTEFNFVDEEFDTATDFSKLESLEISESTQTLKSNIKQTKQQKDSLLAKLNERSLHGISLGGFFQPQQLGSANTPGAKKINSLLSELKSKENKLSSLTRELEMSEAHERIEQAELTRKAETHSKLAAENRMRQAIEQAQTVTGQFQLAMEQANQAVIAHQEEEKLRICAEDEAKDAKMRANNAELAMQNERMARLAAEEKMQEAINKAENTTILQDQLLQVKEQLQKVELLKTNEENRRLDAERHYEEINARFIKVEGEYKQSSGKIFELEHSLQELQKKANELQEKVYEITAQRDKLKEIITAEQKLRRISEQKMQEAIGKAEQEHKARLESEKQAKIIDERAKRAVEHASKTVMHILNAPDDQDYTMQSATKPKIKVPTESRIKDDTVFDFEEEDFNF